MKKCTLLLIPAVFFSLISTASAADVLQQLPIKHALENEKVKAAINSSIPLFWGDQKHPATVKDFGTFKTTKRTNAAGKSDEEACEWALASAIITMQERATREGGNAVINIKSNIKNQPYSSATNFQCLQGSLMVNVALEGTVVTLGK
jgi:uncharacterized protein YbjQ (UPF0145 family)